MVKWGKGNGRVRITIRTFIAGLVFILLAAPLFASGSGAVYLRYAEGGVQLLPSGTRNWLPVSADTPLAQGDSLRIAGAGNAELLIRDGTLLRVTKGSRLKIISIERSAIQFYIESGKAYVNFMGLEGYPLFMSTPSAQIDVLERATFRVDVDAKKDTHISVLTGELFAVQPQGKMKVIAGTRLIMKKAGTRPLYTKPSPADEWERWNRARDIELQPASGQGRNPAPAGPQAYPEEPEIEGQLESTGSYVYVESAPVYVYYYPRYYRGYPCGGWYGPCYRGYIGPGYRYGGYRHRGPYRGWPGPGRRYHRRPYRR